MWTQPKFIVWIYRLGVGPLVGRSNILRVDDTPHRVTDVLVWSPAKCVCEPRELVGVLQAQALEVYRAMCIQDRLQISA